MAVVVTVNGRKTGRHEPHSLRTAAVHGRIRKEFHCSQKGGGSPLTINSSRPEHTKRTQGNAEQHKATHAGQAEPTQPKQHQQTKNQHRGSRTLLETTNDRKPNPTHQPQAAPIETTTQGLPQPHRPSQPNLPRTTLDPTRHPRQHRTRTSNVQAPHGITPCGVCARYSAA